MSIETSPRDPSPPASVALATPLAPGGVGVAYLVGAGARGILDRTFRARSKERLAAGLTQGSFAHGTLVDPDTGEEVDEVLVRPLGLAEGLGEGFEIDGHGGIACGKRLIGLFERLGARRVDPGDLVRQGARGLGIDDTRALARALVPSAPTLRAARFLLAQASGAFADSLDEIERGIRAGEAGPARDSILALLGAAGLARGLLEGVDLTLLGAPNAGKSTLMNALLGAPRVLVDAQSGTTRDVVIAPLAIEGVLFRIADTAGVRDSTDPIEIDGIARSLERARLAGRRLVVVDATTGEVPAGLSGLAGDRSTLAFVNKADLAGSGRAGEVARSLPWPSIRGSAKTGEGVAEVARELARPWRAFPDTAGLPFVEAHACALREAVARLDARDSAGALAALATVRVLDSPSCGWYPPRGTPI